MIKSSSFIYKYYKDKGFSDIGHWNLIQKLAEKNRTGQPVEYKGGWPVRLWLYKWIYKVEIGKWISEAGFVLVLIVIVYVIGCTLGAFPEFVPQFNEEDFIKKFSKTMFWVMLFLMIIPGVLALIGLWVVSGVSDAIEYSRSELETLDQRDAAEQAKWEENMNEPWSVELD